MILVVLSLFEELQENGDPEILKMLPTELTYRLKTSLNSEITPMTKELPTVNIFFIRM